jgi:glycosyltransferase involved in cell wall biosynthesis
VPTTLLVVENATVPEDPRVWAECKTLRDQGWDVVVVCPRGPRGAAAAEVIEDVRIFRFDGPDEAGGVRAYVGEYVGNLRRIRSIVRSLSRESRFDVVHVASPPDFLLLAARGLRKRGAATIFDHHDLSPELYEVKFGRRGIGFRGLLAAERIGFALSDVVISTNDSFKRVAVERGRRDPADVFVVRNGPDPSIFRPGSGDPELRRAGQHLIGYAGRMGSQDGLLEAIETLGILRGRRSDWHAIFAGDGEMLPHARDRAKALGIADVVDFAGFVESRERLVDLLASCDVCISPEPKNPLNDQSTLIKVAEYMAVGKPIVAFDLHETRTTAQGAATFVNSIEDFATEIGSLFDDPARRERMGQIGRERVLTSLGWQRSEERLLAAYARALERSNARLGERGVASKTDSSERSS